VELLFWNYGVESDDRRSLAFLVWNVERSCTWAGGNAKI
jgi:hypothetical protein